MMDKILMLFAVAAFVLLPVSCTKEGPKRFDGNYTFKTSGTITVRAAGDESAVSETIALSDESGQMDVVIQDKQRGKMVVAMNILGGSVLTFEAVAQGTDMTITPFTRQITVPQAQNNIIGDVAHPQAQVKVRGYAQKYTDALLFWIEYEGSYKWLDTEYVIVESNITCWAKEN